jgi:hypothetical protein
MSDDTPGWRARRGGTRRGTRRGITAASVVRYAEQDEKDAKRMTARALELAVALGWCQVCGVTVDEAAGRLHDQWCAVPLPRRSKREGE